MAVKFSNNAKTTLSSALSTTATSVSVADASKFPTLGTGDYTYATIAELSNSSNLEIVKVTAISSNTLTVVRAQQGTSALSFSSGDLCEVRVTAGTIEEAITDVSDTLATVATTGAYSDLSGTPDLSSYIDLTDLSVTVNSAGTANLTYDNATGGFSYTPPDLSGYLTSYTETDTLSTVTNRGNTTNQNLVTSANVKAGSGASDEGFFTGQRIYRTASGGGGLNFTNITTIRPTNNAGTNTNGSLSLGESSYRFADAFFSGTVTSGDIATDGLSVDTNVLLVDATNDRVGINESSPSTELHIYDSNPDANTSYTTVTIETDTANSRNASVSFVADSTGTVGCIGGAAGGTYLDNGSGGCGIRAKANGDVGMYTNGSATLPDATLKANGEFEIAANIIVDGYVEADEFRPTGQTVSAMTVASSGALTTGNDMTVSGGLNVGGSAIGSRSNSISVVGDDNSSTIASKTTGYDTVFSVLPWSSSITYLGTGTYYDDGSWVHASDNALSSLLALAGDGVHWYASSGSTANFDVASNVALWNSTGQWDGDINTTFDINTGAIASGKVTVTTASTTGVEIDGSGASSYLYINGPVGNTWFGQNASGEAAIWSSGSVEALTIDSSGNASIDNSLTVGDGTSTASHIAIKPADDTLAEDIQFYNGTTRIGEIGTQDTTWLRINQETSKNIYTPRYIRADNGFFVDGTAKGINGSGNFIGGTIAGASDANVSNWDTAYGWGNHATAGYATGTIPTNNNQLTNGAGYINSSFNVSSGSSTSDPNSNTDSHFLTNHSNSPFSGVYSHIQNHWWSTNGGNVAQHAVTYNGSTARFAVRHRYSGSWTGWSEMASLSGATFSGTVTFNGRVNIRGHIDLSDNEYLYFGSGDDVEFFCNGSHMYTDLNSGIGNWYIRDGSTTRFTFDDAGHFTATGNVTAYSDVRLKEDIETLDGSKVYEMRGVSFTKEGEAGSGVIAQELQKVAPELVMEQEVDGYLSVAYGNLVGYLIEAVKEQKKEIDRLKEMIGGLKNDCPE